MGRAARTAAALAPGASPTDWVSTGLEALRAEQTDGGRATLDALAATVLDLRLFLARTDDGLRVVAGGGAPDEALEALTLHPQASLDRALEVGANRRGRFPEDADLDALYAALQRARRARCWSSRCCGTATASSACSWATPATPPSRPASRWACGA
ncbi:MAG: hypothetical protein H6704_09160 [Myxococcales bacterium]|nr:hypothetical protein [Myxococcales bacterium]